MKLEFKKSRFRGFTLIGLLMSTAISMIVVAALISSYITVKNEYNSHKDKTEVEAKELLVKSIIYDFVKDVGFACKFGYFNQDYYDSTADSLDNYFTSNSAITIGPLPFPSGSSFSGALEKDCSGECFQADTDYIMVKKEESHTELNAVNALDTKLSVNSISDISVGDYLLLCNKNSINLVKASSINTSTNIVGLSRAPQSTDYYPGDYVGKYSLEILYIRDTGQKDKDGQGIYSLYVYIKGNSSTGKSYELVRGVQNMQVEYATINNSNVIWNSISTDTAIDTIGYSAIKVLFSIDGRHFSKVVNL